MAEQVAEFLRSYLGSEIRLKESRAGTTSSQAWTLVQRAEKRRKDADSLIAAAQTAPALELLELAEQELARAEQADPRWAQPLLTRAGVAYQRARVEREQPLEAGAAVDSGIAYADRALALEPRSADALEVRGKLEYLRVDYRLVPDGPQWQSALASAERDLRAAVDANPTQAGAWATLSRLAYKKQDVQFALLAAQRAYASDAYLTNAREILGRLFWTSHDAEMYPDAIKWCSEGHRRFPRDMFFVECRLWMMTTKAVRPDPDEAWRDVDSLRTITPPAKWPYESRMGQMLAAGVLAKAGLTDSAGRVLERAHAPREVDPDGELFGIEIVMRLFMKDYDRAMTMLGQYLAEHPDHRKGLATNTSPWWRDPKVQNDPRFRALIAGAR